MWTTHNFPREAVRQKYNVNLDDAWLQKLQRSVVRLETGCTGSFVSPDGLILTNHHCAQSCLAENSTAARDLVANGFVSPDRAEEIKCQGEAISVLMDTEDVTPAVTKATASVPPADAARVRNETLTALESRCEEASKKTGTPLKCESVSLYQGGQYWLYKYKRYDDVRLAFAPEQAVAAFGGDPDNFQFPRWCLDMSLLRAYENGKPAATPAHLKFNWAGARDKEPVFVAGHPGTTQRLLTVAQLKTERDLVLPFWLLRFSELRGRLIQYSKSSPRSGAHRQGLPRHHRKQHQGPSSTALRAAGRSADGPEVGRRAEAARVRQERSRRSRAAPAAPGTTSPRRRPDGATSTSRTSGSKAAPAFNSDLFAFARQIVRAADERAKPNADRLREYTEARLAGAEAGDRRRHADLSRVRAGTAVVLARADARVARAGSPDGEGGARIRVAGRARQGARRRLEARRRQGARGALRRRPEGRGGQHRSDDPGRARDRRRGTLAAENLRNGSRRPGPARAAGDLRGAIQGVRHQSLSRRDVHAPRHLRRGRGLERARHAGRSVHPPRADVRARRPASRRSRCPNAGSTPRAKLDPATPAPTSPPRPTSSAAIPAARW